MSTDACGCVYATSLTSESVRLGYEVGGYLQTPCERHGGVPRIDSRGASTRRYLLEQIDRYKREYERAVEPFVRELVRLENRRPYLLEVPYGATVPTQLSQLHAGTLLDTLKEPSRPRE